jgi:folate-binding protein YgfZ
MGLFQLDSYVLLLSGNDCLTFIDGLSTNKVTGTCTTVFTDQNAKIIDMVDVITVGPNIALVGHEGFKENLVSHLISKILQQDVTIRDITLNNKVYLSTEECSFSEGVTVVETFRGWLVVASNATQLQPTMTLEEFNDYRVENLIPHQGYEITSSVHPFNCGLEHLVHDSKGCYIGQEILTRMRSRNKMGKQLIQVENPTDSATTFGTTMSLDIRK